MKHWLATRDYQEGISTALFAFIVGAIATWQPGWSTVWMVAIGAFLGGAKFARIGDRS